MTRCSACNKNVANWESHIKRPAHIKNVEKQRQKERVTFDKDCPLCTIPFREQLLFENELVYLVPTKDLKGHKVRIMAAIKNHSKNPTFEERSFAYACVIDYISTKTDKFFLAAPKEASIPDHWHLIACDSYFSSLDEKESLFTNPYIELPLLKKRVLIGIPAYNEEKTIQKIIKESSKYGDVIVIDDGSTDNTREIALKEEVIVKSNSKRLGYGTSIKEIFKYANNETYDILVTLDADGQHDPSEIPKFLDALKKSEVVIGNRFSGKDKTPVYRKFGIKTVSKFSGIGDAQCGFRAYTRDAVLTVLDSMYERGMGVSIEILRVLQKNNFSITEILCTVKYTGEKHSQNPISQGFDLISTLFLTTLWTKPSKVLVPLGLISLFIAAISAVQTINLYVQFKTIVLSWALLSIGSLICTLLIFNTLMTILVQKGCRVYEK